MREKRRYLEWKQQDRREDFKTGKLSYRKDDHAMRPIYMGALNFPGVPDYAQG